MKLVLACGSLSVILVLFAVAPMSLAGDEIPGDLVFRPDPGVRVTGAGLAHPSFDPATGLFYLYYESEEPRGEFVATSTDGLVFSAGSPPEEWLHDPRVLLMPEPDEEGAPIYRRYILNPDGTITSESSPDGVHFVLDPGVRYRPHPSDNGTIGVFDHFVDTRGGVVLLYIGDMQGLNNVRRAYSLPGDNGLNFVFERGDVLGDSGYGGGPNSFVDQKSVLLPDGRRRLFVMRQGTIYSFISEDDGRTFIKEPGIRLRPSDFPGLGFVTLHDPWAIVLPDGRTRIYLHGMIRSPGGKMSSAIVSATSER